MATISFSMRKITFGLFVCFFLNQAPWVLCLLDPDYQRNLEIIQQHIFLAITSTVSSLQVLDGALSQLGYTADRVSGHWGHRETGGSLQWTTVRITQRTRHSVTVRVGYRYSAPCILRPPIQPEECGLKLKVVFEWRDIYIENIGVVSLMAGLKIEGNL